MAEILAQKIENHRILLVGLLTMAFAAILLSLSHLSTDWLLGILAVSLIWVLILKIEWGIYLMAFFLPVIHWDFYIGPLQIPLIDALGILVLSAFFARHFLLIYLGEKQPEKLKWPALGAFSVFFLAALVSAFFSPTILKSAWYSIRWILLFYMAYIFLPINIIKDRKTLRSVIALIIASAVITGVLGLMSIAGQNWRQEFVRVKPIEIAGVFPLGENQNLIVEVMLPAILLVFAMKEWARSARSKRLLNLTLIFLVLILIGTFSRGGWLALVAAGLVYAIAIYRKQIQKYVLPLILILIALTPVFVYMYRIQTDYETGVGSNQSRILSSRIAWQAFLDKPFFGNGSGEYINLVGQNVLFRAKFGDPLESHGIFQKILAENGLAGLLGFSLMLMVFVRTFYCGLKNNKNEFRTLLPIILAGLAIFIFEIFNTSYYKGKLWLPIAIGLVYVNLLKQTDKIYPVIASD